MRKTSYHSPKTEIRGSAIEGRGIFATQHKGIMLISFLLFFVVSFGCSKGVPFKGTLLVVSAVKTVEADLGELFEYRRQTRWHVETRVVEKLGTEEIQSLIVDEKAKDETISHVLLVGDDDILPMVRIPNYRTQKYEGDWLILSDDPYGMPGADGVPRLAIGRFPSNKSDELVNLSSKIVAYENALDSLKPGVFIFAGRQIVEGDPVMGMFSPQEIADNMSTSFINDISEKLRQNYVVRAQTAFPGENHFEFDDTLKVFKDELAKGPLMSCYAGHSTRSSFSTYHDSEHVKGIRLEDIAQLKECGTSGPFFSGGCAMLEPKDDKSSIGKEMLLVSGGPAAIVGYSRVNDDFCVMQFFELLADELLQPRKCTLGELIQKVKKRNVEEPASPRTSVIMNFMTMSGQLVKNGQDLDYLQAVRKNNALLTIFGDPTTTLRIPRAQINET